MRADHTRQDNETMPDHQATHDDALAEYGRIDHMARFNLLVASRVDSMSSRISALAVVMSVGAGQVKGMLPWGDEDEWKGVVFSVAAQCLSAALVACSKPIANCLLQSSIDQQIHTHIALLMEDIESTLTTTVRPRLDKNFRRMPLSVVSDRLYSRVAGGRDRIGLDDETKLIACIDDMASKLRRRQFTLDDLGVFYEIGNVFVAQDVWIDVMLKVQACADTPMCPEIAAVLHQLPGTTGNVMFTIRTALRALVAYVTTGETDDLELNDWVNAMIANKSGSVLKNSTSIWLYRLIVFCARELQASGTVYVARIVEHICQPYSFFFVENWPGRQSTPLAPGLSNLRDLQTMMPPHTPDPGIKVENKRLMLGEHIEFRKGWTEGGSADVAEIKTGGSVLIMRFFFTVQLGTNFAAINVGSKEHLLGLLKPTDGFTCPAAVNLDASPLFYQLFTGQTWGADTAMVAGRLILS